MWIFNLDGFFSVVEHRDHPSMVMIRARYREDLKNVARKIGGCVRHTPTHDYPYRMICLKERWVVYMADSAAKIDYGNFKDAALRHAGDRRTAQYHKVWATMGGLIGDSWPDDFYEEYIDEQERIGVRRLREHDPEEQDRRRCVQHRRRR